MGTGRISRRAFLKTTGLGATAAVMKGCVQPEQRRTGSGVSDRPNILVIHTDEHRIECLGAYGNSDIRTPHIDRLARDGIVYFNSFCPYPVCTPSRYSLLSGLYVHEHRGWGNRSTLQPSLETFPRTLRRAGYRTKAVGKMHFTPTYLDVGFVEMELAEQDGPGRWDDDYHRDLMERGLFDGIDLEDQRGEYRKQAPDGYWRSFGAKVSDLDEKHHSTTWIADRAMDALAEWDDKAPQLLMAAFVKPHHPFDPPAPWHEMYDRSRLDLLPGWTTACLERDLEYSRGYFPHESLDERALRRVMALYYATISQIDHHVGRMIDLLEQKGLYDDTLIVFTADHGDYMGFHHMLLKGNHMYDPVVKVPLVIKWPGSERAGTVSQDLVNNIDIAPTLIRAAGCRPGSGMHGLDLRDGGVARDLVFAESAGGRQVMARSRTHKLIVNKPGLENLFFDLEKDPQELNNLYEDPSCREIVERMSTTLESWRCKDPKPKAYQNHDARQIDQSNVPPRDLSHRPAVIDYYKRKMTESRRR